MLSLDEAKKTPDIIRIAKTARAALNMDMAPLKELIHRHIDEEKIRASKMDYGLVVYNLSEGKTEYLYLEDIPEGKLHQYILASCAYPIFPPCASTENFTWTAAWATICPTKWSWPKAWSP